MRERNFETSHLNYRIEETLLMWKKWPDSKNIVEDMSKMLALAASDGAVEIRVKKQVLAKIRPYTFTRKELAMDHGKIEGEALIFEVKPREEREPGDSKLSVRMGTIKGVSFLIFETPADRAFGFVRPEDVISIRV